METTASSNNDNQNPKFNISEVLLWTTMFVGMASAAGLYFFLINFLPEPMKASQMSMGVISRVDFVGWAMLPMALIAGILNRQYVMMALLSLLACAFLYFSYFGAIDVAASMGEDTFVQAVVSEQGCFPEKWIPIAENKGFTLPSSAQLCN